MAVGYPRAWWAGDAIAGVTLWALVVPEAMAYASIAGVLAQFGLGREDHLSRKSR
ncbi:MAG: SulP family inorganic anion transporter [Candidatus Nanopelagicales bacterium]